MNQITSFQVNGTAIEKVIAPRTHLADLLREELNLTATHLGCEHGVCGACTVIVDGRPVRSCLTYAVTCANSNIVTLEGLEQDSVMGLLRSAFNRHHALQCGYCTPGMLATAYDIVTRLPRADEARVREELAGNLCRCTGYMGIVAAILDVIASGPHARTLPELTRANFEPSVAPILAARAASPITQALAASAPTAPIVGGVTLSRTAPVATSVDRLWAAISNIQTAASCMPGASVESINSDGTVTGVYEMKLGPIHARFRGLATVNFDNATRTGMVRGNGGDQDKRSAAEGEVRFQALPQPDGSASLKLDITYRLTGPLAQFGRPALVAALVDQMLGVFAERLGQAAEGKVITPDAADSLLKLIWRSLAQFLKLARKP